MVMQLAPRYMKLNLNPFKVEGRHDIEGNQLQIKLNPRKSKNFTGW